MARKRGAPAYQLVKERELFKVAGSILAIEDGRAVAEKRSYHRWRWGSMLVVFAFLVLAEVGALYYFVVRSEPVSYLWVLALTIATIISVTVGIRWTLEDTRNEGPYRFHERGISVYWSGRLRFLPWEKVYSLLETEDFRFGRVLCISSGPARRDVEIVGTADNYEGIKEIVVSKMAPFGVAIEGNVPASKPSSP